MKHTKILTVLATALLLSSGASFAEKIDTKDMEYCTVTDKDGNNLVKAGAADCNSLIKMNCKAHDNLAGDAHASILVPKGQCDKIKANDFSGVTKEMAKMIKSKLDTNRLSANPTVK